MTTHNKSRLAQALWALAIATIGWIYLFSQSWKLAGAILLVIWANNITIKLNNK